METNNKANNNTFGTLLAWGVGGFIVWNLLPPSVKENAGKLLYQLSDNMAASQIV